MYADVVELHVNFVKKLILGLHAGFLGLCAGMCTGLCAGMRGDVCWDAYFSDLMT